MLLEENILKHAQTRKGEKEREREREKESSSTCCYGDSLDQAAIRWQQPLSS